MKSSIAKEVPWNYSEVVSKSLLSLQTFRPIFVSLFALSGTASSCVLRIILFRNTDETQRGDFFFAWITHYLLGRGWIILIVTLFNSNPFSDWRKTCYVPWFKIFYFFIFFLFLYLFNCSLTYNTLKKNKLFKKLILY